MIREFMELSLYIQKGIALGIMMLAATCMFVWTCIRIYNFVSKYTKNAFAKLFVVFFVGTNITALILMLLAKMIGGLLAS